jgi:hypothetical protein
MTLQISTHRLDPAEADIRITGIPGLTGRVMGPRCHYASTVEVAYYLKPLPDGGQRAIIPEPSFWDPQTPFCYEAILHAADGTKVTRRHGLRTVQLTAAGWRVNRKPFRVQGVGRGDLADAAALRSAGVNTILCPVSVANATVWERADMLGFFVLGLLSSDPAAVALAEKRKGHASCLGWILTDADLSDPERLQTRPGHEPVLGLRAVAPPAETPPWVRYLAGPIKSDFLPWLQLSDADDDAAAPLGPHPGQHGVALALRVGLPRRVLRAAPPDRLTE